MTPSLWRSGLALPPSKLDTDIHISSSTCSESIASTLINIVALTIWYLNQVDLAKEGRGYRLCQLNWSPTNSHQLVLVVNFSTVFGTCSAISSLDASAFTCTNSNLAFFIQICIISSGDDLNVWRYMIPSHFYRLSFLFYHPWLYSNERECCMKISFFSGFHHWIYFRVFLGFG